VQVLARIAGSFLILLTIYKLLLTTVPSLHEMSHEAQAIPLYNHNVTNALLLNYAKIIA